MQIGELNDGVAIELTPQPRETNGHLFDGVVSTPDRGGVERAATTEGYRPHRDRLLEHLSSAGVDFLFGGRRFGRSGSDKVASPLAAAPQSDKETLHDENGEGDERPQHHHGSAHAEQANRLVGPRTLENSAPKHRDHAPSQQHDDGDSPAGGELQSAAESAIDNVVHAKEHPRDHGEEENVTEEHQCRG